MICMKFGGTSVQDAQAIDRIAAIVRERLPENPVVVVSALAKITDQLLAMAASAGAGDRDKALELSRAARERHYSTASELLGTSGFAQIHPELEADFNALDDLLRGIVAVGELTLRTTDNVAGFGERISGRMVAAAFSLRGINATSVDSRKCLVTDANFGRAIPQFEETTARLAEIVRPLLARGRVPIMGGFIGSTREGIPTTLGRGGSDFTAAIVGAGLDATRIEIWTDVDGMMTTDPTLCPDAKRIKTISFEEAAELAYFGAKVLHPATLLPAIQKNIPVLVLNSRNAKNERRLRPPSLPGGYGLDLGSQRIGNGRFQRIDRRHCRRSGKTRRREVRRPKGDRLSGRRKHPQHPRYRGPCVWRDPRGDHPDDFAGRF